jgi:hypothetical protein
MEWDRNMNRDIRSKLLRELNALGPVAEERETGANEYDAGSMARHCGEGFNADRSRPWKLGWLDADELLAED